MKWHIHPDTKMPLKCKAKTPETCKFDVAHFNTYSEAQVFSQIVLESNYEFLPAIGEGKELDIELETKYDYINKLIPSEFNELMTTTEDEELQLAILYGTAPIDKEDYWAAVSHLVRNKNLSSYFLTDITNYPNSYSLSMQVRVAESNQIDMFQAFMLYRRTNSRIIKRRVMQNRHVFNERNIISVYNKDITDLTSGHFHGMYNNKNMPDYIKEEVEKRLQQEINGEVPMHRLGNTFNHEAYYEDSLYTKDQDERKLVDLADTKVSDVDINDRYTLKHDFMKNSYIE